MVKGFVIVALWLAVQAAFLLSLAAPAAPAQALGGPPCEAPAAAVLAPARPRPALEAQPCELELRVDEELVVQGTRPRVRLAHAR